MFRTVIHWPWQPIYRFFSFHLYLALLLSLLSHRLCITRRNFRLKLQTPYNAKEHKRQAITLAQCGCFLSVCTSIRAVGALILQLCLILDILQVDI